MKAKIETLGRLPENIKRPYISHIRFPFYKNFIYNAKISFNYPITAIVGMNGSSKSSVLRAIYGAPSNKSISDYWFESKIDELNDEDVHHKPRSAFIYGYFNEEANRSVEVIKTRIKNKDNPDYWEPSRPIIKFGMAPMPSDVPEGTGRTKTRWNVLKKEVVYLDFRHEAVSAFDKYFYSGNLRKTQRIKTKQDFIREKSKHLKKIIDNNLKTYVFHRMERLFGNELLPDDQVATISKILGKNYTQIRIVNHKLYYTEEAEKTIYLTVNNGPKYSEAFAGSGEFAIVSLVKNVMDSPNKSLILLDEPEVSVHPSAQERMLEFLVDEAIRKKHQIVFTTHSPSMIKHLPPEAIHVFYEDGKGNVNIRSNVYPREAFSIIGADFEKKAIIVEDVLAKLIIERILDHHGIMDQFDVVQSPNGENAIKTRAMVDTVTFGRNNVIYILDGDQKLAEHIDPDGVPINQNSQLGELIKEQTGCDIDIPYASGRKDEKIRLQRAFLSLYKNHVYYFPVFYPEDMIWEEVEVGYKKAITDSDVKERFRKLSLAIFRKDTSKHILSTQEIYVNKLNCDNNPHCTYLYNLIRPYLEC